MARVTVEKLSKRFEEGKPILDRLDLEIGKGEFFGIIGPNGTGKTTLLRLIAGYLDPDSGKVLINGEAPNVLPRRTLARILAFVPQESHVVFPFSVMEVVMQGRYPYLGRFGFEKKEDLDVVRWALETTDTFSMRHRWIGDLSGGERQRVIIARALAQEPDILLLDEPTSFLDIKHKVKIHDLLKRLNRERGVTVISVLHDLTMASTYFDRLCLLYQGKAAALGRPEEVIRYELISKVYDTEVYIDINAVTGRPYIIPLGKPDPCSEEIDPS
jgi:iron complex transport system ATP-binding protein